ncbi:MAG: recombination regulator RecX [Spirochaetaceae bacterium]|nr:recombination regulator RecX [Spirochaetaceae bacterium]
MLAEDSSSASVNGCYTIISLKWAEEDLVRVTASLGFSYLMRPSYLQTLSAEDLSEGLELDEEGRSDMLHAEECYRAEIRALASVARSEQCSTQMQYKLEAKGFSKASARSAVDRLKELNFINDRRFALAWLTIRTLRSGEGRIKLISGLMAKGMDRDLAADCVDEFLTETPEEELLQRAREKCLRQGKNREETIKTLQNRGFIYSNIQKNV